MDTGELDTEDLDLVAALQVAPRAPLAQLAEVLGCSSSTVSRRLARLEAERLLRVIGQVDWTLSGYGNPWHVWVDAGSGQADEVARTLGELPESQFVATTAGRTDVYCAVQAGRPDGAHELLSKRIPAMPGVRSAHSELVLRGVSKADSWRLPRLADEQVRALRDDDQPHVQATELGEDERRTLDLLRGNGRITTAQVARELGVGQSTAYRMAQSLLRRGLVRPRVEIEPRLLGYALEAVVALTVAPGSVNTVAGSLAGHRSARYVSIVAGSSSVVHHGAFRDEDALADFLTEDLGGLPGVSSFDVSVVLDVRKRYWLDRTGGRVGG